MNWKIFEKKHRFFCTPFETRSLKELVKIGIEGIKISSDNLNNTPFLIEAENKVTNFIIYWNGELPSSWKCSKNFSKIQNFIDFSMHF